VKLIESLLQTASKKLYFQNLESCFHKCQVSFLVDKSAKCKRGITNLERFGSVPHHRSARRVISGGLASTPVPLLLLESLTSQLEISLNAFAFYERALRLLADYFPLAFRPVQTRLKKRPSWRFFCSSQENQAPREKLILCPSTPPNFTVTTFIEGCSRSDPGRFDTADDFLRSLLTSDVVLWTDGSVPLLWAPEVQVSMLAEDAHPPPH